jgi:hypothetical protein
VNCPRCQAPADPGARICLHCGAILKDGGTAPTQSVRDGTLIGGASQQQPIVLPAWPEPGPAINVRSEVPTVVGRVVRPGAAPAGMGSPTAGAVQQLASTAERPRRRRGWCLPGCLVTLLVLLVLLVSSWFFLARPMLNAMARQQINNALEDAVQQIDPGRAALLPGGPFILSETLLNNFLTLAHSPASPLQNAHFTITPSAIILDFTLYGFGCSISAVPQADNGQLSVRDLHTQGIISLILSDDDIQTLVNQHLAEAQQHLHHAILAVTLREHEVDLLIGPPAAADVATSL